MTEASLREHEEVTKVKNVSQLELGRFVMYTWYFSPIPNEYFPDGFMERLYCCEFTLKFFRHKSELERFHRKKNPPRHPPGNEIYRSTTAEGKQIAMFEMNPVDSSAAHEYCQNLCYLGGLH